MTGSSPTGWLQSADPILEGGPGGPRVDRTEDRNHEGIRVPEDMAGVSRSGESPGGDGRLTAPGRRRDQVEETGAHRQRGVDVADDLHVAVGPPLTPRCALAGEQCRRPQLHGWLQQPRCGCGGGRRSSGHGIGGQTLDGDGAARLRVRWAPSRGGGQRYAAAKWRGLFGMADVRPGIVEVHVHQDRVDFRHEDGCAGALRAGEPGGPELSTWPAGIADEESIAQVENAPTYG